MRIRMLGTGYGECKLKKRTSKEYRGRGGVLIDDTLLIDAPADLLTVADELGISDGETTADGMFTLKNVACLGCCSLSPVMMINDETYGSLTPDKTKEILRGLKEKEA